MLYQTEISNGWQTNTAILLYSKFKTTQTMNLNDEDIAPVEILDMRKERYHSRDASRMTALRWVHKLGFKLAYS